MIEQVIKNVLIVDDRPENLLSLEAILESKNLNIIKAGSGNEALGLMTEHEFALVLLDVQMPEMDGFETAQLMRGMKKTRNIPIIFVTAISKERKHVFEGFKAGAIDYIYKPIDSEILNSKVQIFLELFEQKKLLQIQASELQNRIRELEELRSELEEANRMLEHLSSHDGLTGILNRRSFDDILIREWKRGIREKREVSLILFDVDYFKKYNDVYGHIAGDNCLRLIAKAFAKTVQRPSDFVARYGGEEFVAILPNTPMCGAEIIAKNIQEAIDELGIVHKGSEVSDVITVSVGVSHCFPSDELTIEKLIHEADEALYIAKKTGRNKIESKELK